MKNAENKSPAPAESPQIPLPLSSPTSSSPRPAGRAAAVRRLLRSRRALVVLGAALALAVILPAVLSRGPGRTPGADAWRAAAAEFVAGKGLVSVGFAESPVRPAGESRPGEAENRGRVMAKLPGALYEPVDARAYLADELKLDVSVPEKIERLLAGPGATRIQQIAGVDPKDNGSPGSLSLVRETAPAGTRVEFDVTMSATLTNAGWRARVTESSPATAVPAGRPLAEFEGRVLDVSRESDVEQIRRIMSGGGETLARLEKARAQFLAELESGGEKALEKIAGRLRAGAFFTGGLSAGGEAGGGLGVSLEVTAVNPAERTLAALLRTENGWSDSRAATGRFSSDPATGMPLLTLESDAAQAARGAGPLVGDETALRLEFAAQADALTSRIPGWRGNLRLLTDAARVPAIAKLRAAEGRLRAEFAPGRVFRASVRPAGDGGEPGEFLLRITKLDADGALEAALESVANDWTRPVRGALVANRHRAAGRPLRLESGAAERVPGAPRAGLLGADGFSLAFAEEEGGFGARMADGGTITLAPASPRDVAAVAKRRAELRELAFFVAREGAAYDGMLARAGGAGERVRLRFGRVDPRTGAVEAVLDSIARPGVRRALRGSVEPGTGALVLETAGGAAKAGPGGDGRESWFGEDGASVFDLALSLREITGRARGQRWTLAFPVAGGNATALPTDRWPAGEGAYAWADGQWRALPANNGRIKRSLLQKTGRAADTVLSWVRLGSKDEEGSAAGTLVFDGGNPAPVVPGAGVTLLFRGALARPADVGEAWPLIEVTPLEMKKAGADRRAALLTVTKDFASAGDRREAAVTEEMEPGVTLLRAGRTLPPGRYALYAGGAGGAAYEFEVR